MLSPFVNLVDAQIQTGVGIDGSSTAVAVSGKCGRSSDGDDTTSGGRKTVFCFFVFFLNRKRVWHEVREWDCEAAGGGGVGGGGGGGSSSSKNEEDSRKGEAVAGTCCNRICMGKTKVLLLARYSTLTPSSGLHTGMAAVSF